MQSELNQDELARHAERLKRRAANSREEIREINSALRRISSGEYGYCTRCGQRIPQARLEAHPTAERCVRCQALHESTYATKATPTL